MKIALLSLITFASAASFAAQSTIYCRSEGKLYNAFSEAGYDACASALRDGSACFTGDAARVAEKIDTITWDEEWLEGAGPVSSKKISYLYKDGPNELSETVTMLRCTNEFFAK